jgi:hypothetical protein
MASSLWTAHPECPEHLKSDLEARVRALPSSFLLRPVAGEVFDDVDLCQERLQGWALSQGFAIVRKSGSLKQARPRFDFLCIHHGRDTANTRRLEKHVEKDDEDRITTRRKQEAININARDCPYLIYLARKQLRRRGSDEYGLILSINNDAHSYIIAINPLRYKKEHVKAMLEYLPAVELSKSLRSANILYLKAFRVLEQVGFPLDRSTYYNIRSRDISAALDEFSGLVVALKEAGFVFECRIEEEFDSNTDLTVNR